MEDFKKECLECNLIIEGFSKISLHKKFLIHIKEHKITNEEYKIKHELNGKPILCACGCGNKVKFTKNKFNKYFSDHKNFIDQKIVYLNKKRTIFKKTLEVRLKELNITVDELIDYYNKFINLEITLLDISRKVGIDYRTIKKYWYELKLIDNKEVFNRICKKSQSLWIERLIIPKEEDYIDFINKLENIEKYLFSNNEKKTIGEIIRIFDLNLKYNYILDFFYKNYDEKKINDVFKFHNQSQIEIEFYNILRFYFGNKIKKQFNLNNKFYDYKLGDKILIELDGVYWHSNENAQIKDKEKDKLAKDNGFIIFRVSDKEVKNIKILNKIQELNEKFNKI
jgi:very-short-patch-repair endonuclease